MPRYALRIEYDGRPFSGWQWQAAHPSVQGGAGGGGGADRPGGAARRRAGRTDAGVHALGQVAHVDLARAWEPAAGRGAQRAPPPRAGRGGGGGGGRARASTPASTRSSGSTSTGSSPAARRWCTTAASPGGSGHLLDVAAMRAGAAALVGRHDFTTFRSSICQARSPVRTLDALEIEETAAPAGASTASGCAPGRSCTTRSGASSARSSGSAAAPGRRSGSARRSPPATERPAARSARRTASTWSRCATRRTRSRRLPEARALRVNGSAAMRDGCGRDVTFRRVRSDAAFAAGSAGAPRRVGLGHPGPCRRWPAGRPPRALVLRPSASAIRPWPWRWPSTKSPS